MSEWASERGIAVKRDISFSYLPSNKNTQKYIREKFHLNLIYFFRVWHGRRRGTLFISSNNSVSSIRMWHRHHQTLRRHLSFRLALPIITHIFFFSVSCSLSSFFCLSSSTVHHSLSLSLHSLTLSRPSSRLFAHSPRIPVRSSFFLLTYLSTPPLLLTHLSETERRGEWRSNFLMWMTKNRRHWNAARFSGILIFAWTQRVSSRLWWEGEGEGEGGGWTRDGRRVRLLPLTLPPSLS